MAGAWQLGAVRPSAQKCPHFAVERALMREPWTPTGPVGAVSVQASRAEGCEQISVDEFRPRRPRWAAGGTGGARGGVRRPGRGGRGRRAVAGGLWSRWRLGTGPATRRWLSAVAACGPGGGWGPGRRPAGGCRPWRPGPAACGTGGARRGVRPTRRAAPRMLG